MSGISFSGLGSGLPIKDIIKATMDVESIPLKRMEESKATAKEQISAYGTLTSRLDALSSAMNKLKGPEKFELIAAKSSNENAFTATADNKSGAVAGDYNITVNKKADNYNWVSKSMANDNKFSGHLKIGDTTLTLGTDEPLTLDQLRKAINENPDLKDKVSANIVNDSSGTARLVINAKLSGEAGRIAIDSSDLNIAGATAPDETTLANDADKTSKEEGESGYKTLDAQITINGIEATSSTNKFTNVISGVTINLNADAAPDASGNLKVARDDDSIKDRLDEFLKAYNDVVIHLNEAKKGPLASEGIISSVEGILRDTLMTPTGGDGNLNNTLASIGITSYVEKGWSPGDEKSSRNGTLEIDSSKLNKMLETDFEKIAFIFGDEETGYAKRFEDAARQMTSDTVQDGRISKGLITVRKSGLTSEISRIDKRMEATEYRLELLEARLYKQFNAADAISSQFQSTGNYLMQQFDSLPGYGSSK